VAANNESLMAEMPSENLDPSAFAALVGAAAAMEPEATATGIEAELNKLPAYSRGLLQILVPVRVTLASQRKSIQEIIELGPGSIVKFDKTCDEPLELSVGDRPIAQGEVVKVGDKFGLKISGLMK
jgi:flagellar motor switch protein FliN